MNDSAPHPKPPTIRRSLVLSFARQYTTLLFGVPTVMILSRLLTPAQIGVYSVAVAATAVIHMLRDFGVSQYLVQEKNLTDDAARTAFTINLIIAWTMAAIVFFGSPLAADFYREPGLGLVLKVLAINFALLPFGSTVTALLTRSMQFGILYRITLGQQVIQSGVTIALAALGFGYMSPAWGAVAGMSATVLGCTWWGRAYRIAGLSLKHWRAVTRFGVQQTVGDIVGQLGFYAPDFVIGRVLTFADVGLYSRGYGLINMFRSKVLGAIGSVSFPAFAESHRSAKDVGALYLKTLTYITGIALPFMIFAGLTAFPIIRAMFGPQWDAAVPILRLLAAAAFINTLASQFGEFFTATGHVGIVTATAVITQVFRLGVLIPASFYGLEAAAASQILAAIFGVAVRNALLYRYTPITRRDVVKALYPSFGITVAAGIVPALVYVFMPASDTADLWLDLVVAGLGGGGGWLAGAWLTRHPLWFEMWNVANRFLHRKRAAA